ncbi:MAG: hypothetical protein JWR80_6738 [Bradyrhizobium sp.]|nr:hypothetical protein [Bradyrhizobium sp.]
MTHTIDSRATRRARLRSAIEDQHLPLNGIDYAESLGSAVPGGPPRVLVVLFAPAPQAPALAEHQLHIDGGVRIRGLRVTQIDIDQQDLRRLTLQLDRLGDFSTYRIRIDPAPQNFDPMFVAAEIGFRLDCPTDIDCQAMLPGPVGSEPGPRIDYLARDFEALRGMLFDRLRATAPHWRERSPGDLGVALVEIFAYVGDMLNYRLDAIDAEAYLATCRSRVSAKRHARLVDYRMHDGRNARAFVQFAADPALGAGSGVPAIPVPTGTPVLTDIGTSSAAGRRGGRLADDLAMQRLVNGGAVVFATLHETAAHPALNRIELHDWGLDQPRLEKGATTATLRDPDGALAILLAPGQFLVFEEALVAIFDDEGNLVGGRRADADPGLRVPVRLTSVTAAVDPLGDPGGAGPLNVVDIGWAREDALPKEFSLLRLPVIDLPAVPGPMDSVAQVQSASIARGAVALADEGLWLEDEDIGMVPAPVGMGADIPLSAIDPPRRFRPPLKRGGLVFAADYAPAAPASSSIAPSLSAVGPAIRIRDGEGFGWTPVPDLINSDEEGKHFTVELEGDGTAFVRFGDDRFGKKPKEGVQLTASYRRGPGVGAEVGAESLSWVRSDNGGIVAARNPLPATGAMAPETVDSVRAKAPGAFREQKRAITAGDYARFAERHPDVARAVATFLWTGAWRTVFVTVDLRNGAEVNDTVRQSIVDHLEPFRRAGHEVAVEGPVYMPIELAMQVCAQHGHFNSQVRERLRQLFSRAGLFAPDRWTFGDPVYLSRLYEAAMGVEGVRDVVITTFRRQDDPSRDGLSDGVLASGRREIAILENDPNFPGRGVASFDVDGGL